MPHAPLSSTIAATVPPPVMEARRWIAGRAFPADRPLLNLSQAAPIEAPHAALCAEIARAAVEEPQAHLYGPVLGLPALRAEIASQWSAHYGGRIAAEDVAITSGCNEAFCAAIATLAAPGEAVMLPFPWYFNHRMWLDTAGIRTVPLPCGPGMVPDVAAARAALTRDTKAIVLVSPNNPTGAEYPAATLAAFLDLAREAGVALIVDETYRDFHSRPGAPHDLFARPDWAENLIHLYSFSKVFRLTGHRVGAMVAAPARLAEVEKFLDSMTICPAQLGQMAALHGLRHLSDWVAGERVEIITRRKAVEAGMAGLPGWHLLGCGAYFAYVAHPFTDSSADLAKALVEEQSLLILPGTMFTPEGAGGEAQFRIAFANADAAGIAEMMRRLHAFTAARARVAAT